jgi:hypothetical protein
MRFDLLLGDAGFIGLSFLFNRIGKVRGEDGRSASGMSQKRIRTD